jgi:outer membrane protein assembly factor BamB
MLAFRRLCVCTAVLSAGCCSRIAQAQGSKLRSNAVHTGVFSGPGVPAFHNLRWIFHLKARFLSSPAVAGDTVLFSSIDGNLYAIH